MLASVDFVTVVFQKQKQLVKTAGYDPMSLLIHSCLFRGMRARTSTSTLWRELGTGWDSWMLPVKPLLSTHRVVISMHHFNQRYGCCEGRLTLHTRSMEDLDAANVTDRCQDVLQLQRSGHKWLCTGRILSYSSILPSHAILGSFGIMKWGSCLDEDYLGTTLVQLSSKGSPYSPAWRVVL